MLESYKDRLLHEPKLTGIVQVDETLLGKNTRAGIEGLWGQLKTALRRTYNTAISCNPSIENTLSMAVEADWRIRNHRKTSFERAKSLIQWTTVEDDDCRTAME